MSIAPGQEITIHDSRPDTYIFGGYIKDVTVKFITPSETVKVCQCQDYTKLVADVTDGVTADYTAGANTEKEILTALFAAHCASITVGDDVIAGELVSIGFTNSSLQRALDELAAINDRVWYVDYSKELHYFTTGDEAAPFDLSDSPDDSATFGYQNLEYKLDSDSNETVTLICHRWGMFAGQTIGITNSVLGWTDKQLLVRNVSISLLAKDVNHLLQYSVTLGSVPNRVTNEIIRSGRVITTARIADLAVTDAKIETCSVDKLTAGTITVQALLGTGGSIASAASGTRIQITPDEIAGYNGSDKQFYLQSSDGKAYAGAGNVLLDKNGINIYGQNVIRLYDASGNVCGYINGYTNTDQHMLLLAQEALVLSAGGAAYAFNAGSGNILCTGTNFDVSNMSVLKVPVSSGAPTNTAGAIYYNSSTNRLMCGDGLNWKTISWT